MEWPNKQVDYRGGLATKNNIEILQIFFIYFFIELNSINVGTFLLQLSSYKLSSVFFLPPILPIPS